MKHSGLTGGFVSSAARICVLWRTGCRCAHLAYPLYIYVSHGLKYCYCIYTVHWILHDAHHECAKYYMFIISCYIESIHCWYDLYDFLIYILKKSILHVFAHSITVSNVMLQFLSWYVHTAEIYPRDVCICRHTCIM